MMSREEFDDLLNQRLVSHSEIQQRDHIVNLAILQVLLDVRELLITKQKG
jgi:hypothetical protein